MGPVNGISGNDPQPQFDYLVDKLDALGLVYLHVAEGAPGGPRDFAPFDYDSLRKRFKRTYIANNGYDRELATESLNAGKADLFAFGHKFIANPDLVERLKAGAPLAQLNPATLYGGVPKAISTTRPWPAEFRLRNLSDQQTFKGFCHDDLYACDRTHSVP